MSSKKSINRESSNDIEFNIINTPTRNYLYGTPRHNRCIPTTHRNSL